MSSGFSLENASLSCEEHNNGIHYIPLRVKSWKNTGKVAFVNIVCRIGSVNEIKFGRAITSSGTSKYSVNNTPVTVSDLGAHFTSNVDIEFVMIIYIRGAICCIRLAYLDIIIFGRSSLIMLVKKHY